LALITKIEAAIKLGVGKHFCEKCPELKQDRNLAAVSTAQGDMIDDKELYSFERYLHSPWPLPPKGSRTYLPEAIREDIRQESHYGYAICGHMDIGEVAHIKPVDHCSDSAFGPAVSFTERRTGSRKTWSK
jgi:hypothetical protein